MGGARNVLGVGAAHALGGCISNWNFSNIPYTGTSLAPRPSGIGCRRCGWRHCSISSISERYSAEHRIRRNAPSGVGHWVWPKGRAWQGWAEPSDLPACSATPQVQCLQQRGRHSQCGFFFESFFKWKKFEKVSLSFSLSHIEVEISVKTKWIESWIFGPFFCFWKREMFERFLLVTILRLQSFYLSWQITVDQKCSGELRSGSWYLRWELMIWDGNKIFFSLRVRLKSSRAASLTRNWLGLEMVKKFIKNWLCTPSRFVSQLGMEMCRVSIPSY